MCAQACELGANATIVSSDKDLMQLVNDCVIMYDTMKDKKIGIPEVIEKFGVPPEKVIEVQSLIGDSTDNVPGVPGIGVKTAAQLIGEYGDLETLLTRAGEIKQEKRRQSLIDNADKARLSKRLVTLDDKVKLDVPLADLAVHEPDYKLLIAFLKAMEFNTLTRRVAEFSGIEAAEIEALAAGRPARRDEPARPTRGEPLSRRIGRHPVALLPACRSPAAGWRRSRGRAVAPPPHIEITPQALERRTHRSRAQGEDRPLALRDRAKPRSPRRPGSRAPATSASSPSTPRPSAKTRCRRRCAASRSRSRRTRPATCRSPIARPATATAGCSAAGSRPTRFPRRTRWRRSSRCSRTRACSRSART